MTNQDVLTDSSPADSEVTKTQGQEPKATEAAKESVMPGSKTPESNLLSALHQERAEKQALAERIKQLEASVSSKQDIADDEVFSDEGKALNSHISTLKSDVERLKESLELDRLYIQHPEIKEIASEFQTFKASYPGLELDKAAKLFLVEKGIHPGLQARKGLEQASGGAKAAPSSTMSDEDLKHLREESPRKYLKLVSEGKI